jgi:hypothetical protein
MLGAMKPYRRRLSREAADTGSMLIEKRAWRALPPPMAEFAIELARRRVAARVVAEDCACVPPQHQHHHLEPGHFRHLLSFDRGAVIEIAPRETGFVIRHG